MASHPRILKLPVPASFGYISQTIPPITFRTTNKWVAADRQPARNSMHYFTNKKQMNL